MGDHRSSVEHDDMLTNSGYKAEIMVNDQDAESSLSGYAGDHQRESCPLRFGHPGRWLIKQQKVWFGGKGTRDLYLATYAERQIARGPLRELDDVHLFHDCAGTQPSFPARYVATRAVSPNLDVLYRSQPAKQAGMLKRATNAEASDAEGRPARHVPAAHREMSSGGRHKSGQDIHERRLARAVGADKADTSSTCNRQIDISEGRNSSKMLRDRARVQSVGGFRSRGGLPADSNQERGRFLTQRCCYASFRRAGGSKRIASLLFRVNVEGLHEVNRVPGA